MAELQRPSGGKIGYMPCLRPVELDRSREPLAYPRDADVRINARPVTRLLSFK